MSLAPSGSLGTGMGGSMGAAPAALQPPLPPPLLTDSERQLVLRTRQAIAQLPQHVRVRLQEHFSAMAHVGGAGSRGSVVAHVREVVQQVLLGEPVPKRMRHVLSDAALLSLQAVVGSGVAAAGDVGGYAEQKPLIALLGAAMEL